MAAILGTAAAAGVGAYHNVRMETQPLVFTPTAGQATAYATVASEVAKTTLRQLEGAGFVVNDYDRAQASSLPERAFRAAHQYIQRDPVPSHWRILEVERTHEQYGHARLDLVVDDGLSLAPVDLKCKLRLDNKYRQKEIEKYRNHWNMLHYCWVVRQVYGVVPRHYYIAFNVLEPKAEVWLEPYVVDEEVLLLWEQSARRIWAHMEADDSNRPLPVICLCVLRADSEGRVPWSAAPRCPECSGKGMTSLDAAPWLVAKHADEYGVCEYYEACFEYKLDPELMQADYLQLGKEGGSDGRADGAAID